MSTCSNAQEADRSIYRWDDKVAAGEEHLLLIKTNSAKLELLERRIAELHSYDVPEVLALSVTAGSEKYLSWMEGALHG